jgi:hypothetical protein
MACAVAEVANATTVARNLKYGAVMILSTRATVGAQPSNP